MRIYGVNLCLQISSSGASPEVEEEEEVVVAAEKVERVTAGISTLRQ